jgi:CheY-like chemotaxis protein
VIMTSTRRALIVDDEPDMRTLLRVLLSDATGDIEVVGEAVDGDEALAAWREQRPDVVVLDQRMPGLSGLEVAQKILAEHPEQQIILFTAYLTNALRDEATAVGVTRCLAKEQVFELPDVIRYELR